ncbi:anthocyanidin 5,3-O-glucosyltransferase-like [Hordeum vulgare subsp. vulgare]|uniref:Glycosyltransferase n=2 Tax=Hordeum vulgare subsp. vulgare TaxID=112509 RepID=A0A8I6X7R0_HORVV|nr:anthocyanidin 5,3-O-glucosyltransferase-like [Hordeum vulgare subsp. vulgare]
MKEANQGAGDRESRRTVVMYPAPGAGHLIPTVEFARLLVSHGLAVIVVQRGLPAGNATVPASSLYGNGDASASPFLSFHYIPEPPLPHGMPEGDHVGKVFELSRASNPELRDFLRATAPAALLLDFFCYSAADVAAEIGIPTYFFFLGCTASLAVLLHLPVIHGQNAVNLGDLGGEPVKVPGVTPIPAHDLPAAFLDRSSVSYKHFLAVSQQLCQSHGVIVNSCRSLEPRATDAVAAGLCAPPGRTTPPLFCIGPVVKSEEVAEKQGEECLAWLDTQPEASVVFLCFGSMGRFSAEQIKEMAAGLEMSGQRFLWVVRSPAGGNGNGNEHPGEPELDVLLPDGFLDRTKDRGLVVMSWAPQREVLAHGSVGGFVTHCGWNSVLEAVMAGVPMLGWPLYAEQRMNKVLLVEGMQLGVAVERGEDGFVTAEEIERKVTWLMGSDGGRELRERTLAAMRGAREALSDGGDSRAALLQLVQRLSAPDVTEESVCQL